MNDIDALLHDAGERWRATQLDPPALDPMAFTVQARPSVSPLLRAATIGLAAIVVVGLAAIAVGLGGSGGVGGPPAGPSLSSQGVVDASPSAAPEASPSPRSPARSRARPTASSRPMAT